MPPERILTPAGPRIYFAAGMGVNGIFNLNQNGQQILENIMTEYLPLPEVPFEPEFLWEEADAMEDGWWYSSWYGWFYGDAYPWMYHNEHGWQYNAVFLNEGKVLYDLEWNGWIWIHADLHPWIYNYDASDWFYYTGKDGSRSFVRAQDGVTIAVPAP
ncbi:MAG: hypothetical protein LR015_01750 [Verrucomicrobia bacterium]|nr:hypothetical protein [Verrucomicrobiota bacterium]